MRNKSAGPLILTPGEPGGVGTEITLKAWAQLCKYEEMRFALIADADHVRSISKQCGFAATLFMIFNFILFDSKPNATK